MLGSNLSFLLSLSQFNCNITRMSSAPLRTITVRDAMSDLPDIKNGASALKIGYSGEPQSHFQRLVGGALYMPSIQSKIHTLFRTIRYYSQSL